jgi:hypothetical protein
MLFTESGSFGVVVDGWLVREWILEESFSKLSKVIKQKSIRTFEMHEYISFSSEDV